MRANPVCQGRAEQELDRVFDTCFADTAPFDEIY